jgi:prolyl oligopeptidase
VLLDLDALARDESENWVWAGSAELGPDYTRWLVGLSRGGADACVVREFDTDTLAFVDGGFRLPEAKSDLSWLDRDQVYVGSDFGADTLTDSGYPRLVKRWARGQPLATAETVFEAERSDIAAFVHVDPTPGYERTLIGRSIDMYRSRLWLLVEGTLQPIDKPDDASAGFWRDLLLFELRSDWSVAARTWPRGALLVCDAKAFMRGERDFTALFTPSATRSLAAHTHTRSRLLLNILDDVASRLEECGYVDGAWQRRTVAAPFPGTLAVSAWHDPLVTDDALAEAYALNYTDFLTPDTLLLGRTGSDALEPLKSRPAYFDATGMRAEQHFATSKDGTRGSRPIAMLDPAAPGPGRAYQLP